MNIIAAIIALPILTLLVETETFRAASDAERYTLITGPLCVNKEFTETVFDRIPSDVLCAMHCNAKDSCQAFTTNDGPCQLFVFDKCSKSVRNCSCSRTGQVFVKQRSGLEPGALCPSGYGDTLCGVKYKLIYQTGGWHDSLRRCQSESGSLVIMSDVIDSGEMDHVDSLYTKYLHQFWLGGFQKAGSVEPLGGWSLVECNITLDGSLWGSGEPSNSAENSVFRSSVHPKLADVLDTSTGIGYTLCECISPFE